MKRSHESQDDPEAMANVLRSIGLEEYVRTFEENLIAIDQVADLSSIDFEKLGVLAIGHRVKIKSAAAALKMESQKSSPAVSKFVELQRKRRKGSTLKNVTAMKNTRRVRVGWKHLVSGNKYKVMTITNGGGMQLIDFNKDLKLREAMTQIVDVFFPNGQSLKYKLDDMKFYLATFANEELTDIDDISVGEYFDTKVKSSPVRWYLHTQLKQDDVPSPIQEPSEVPTKDEESDSLPDLDEHSTTAKMEVHVPLQSSVNVFPQTSTSTAEPIFLETDSPTVQFQLRRTLSLSQRYSRTQVESVSPPMRDIIEVIDSEDEEIRLEGEKEENMRTDIHTEAESVESILKQFQIGTVTSDTVTKVLVQRSRILETAMKGLDRKSINFRGKLYIKFSGEMGEDVGGPRREFFRLVMLNLKSSRYFEGSSDDCKIFRHDLSLLEMGHYRLVGRLVALSFAHNGPGLHFLSTDLYNLMVGKNMPFQDEDKLLPEDMKMMIKKLREADDDLNKDQFTDTYGDQLLDLGIPNVFLMVQKNRQKLIELIVKHHIYYRTSGEISQFCDGMNDVNSAWSMVTTHADLFQHMFCYKPVELTGEDMMGLFKVNYSPQGSNDRALEDTSIYGWELFLQTIEAGVDDVSFEDVLVFVTGASRPPPCGFSKPIDIDFYTYAGGRLPSVSTCALQLWLPRVADPEMIGTLMTRACNEANGFLKI